MQSLLPIRPAPLPDELLSSWLVRLASAHHMKLQSFCHILWPTRSIWNRDPDRSASDALLRSLKEMTGVPLNDVCRTTLRDYERVLFPKYIRNGNTRWLMPLGIYHRVRKRTGLQFCADCLRSDAVPYFRRCWRLSLFAVCPNHGVRLLDRCPGCSHPIHLHRSEMGQRREYRFDNTRCCRCAYSFLEATSPTVDARRVALHMQHEGLLSGRLRFQQETITYFNVLAHLVRLLTSTRPRLRRFQQVVSDLTGTRPAPIDNLQQQRLSIHFDSQPVEVRLELLAAAFELLNQWPALMAEAYGRGELRESDVFRDFHDAPAWYGEFLVSSTKANAAKA